MTNISYSTSQEKLTQQKLNQKKSNNAQPSNPLVDDIRIKNYMTVIPPNELIRQLPVSDNLAQNITNFRKETEQVIDKEDDRLLVIVGPCSIHDVDAAMDYARKLKKLRDELQDDLLIVMRIYFEKPRTTVGWKGLINDPHLDGSFDINAGLSKARELLLQVNQMGLPAATEFLDLLSPQFISDLVCWGAIGARTTESQGHRELASGSSCPVGFKNATSGDVTVAKDALLAAEEPHIFMSVDKEGKAAIVQTKGNKHCHIILRGGKNPNYDAPNVSRACEKLAHDGLAERVMIDFSHANSLKQHKRQILVAQDVAEQISTGEERIIGVMLESFLEEGNQKVDDLKNLKYGMSVTDACIHWQDTEHLLRDILVPAVRQRRKIKK